MAARKASIPEVAQQPPDAIPPQPAQALPPVQTVQDNIDPVQAKSEAQQAFDEVMADEVYTVLTDQLNSEKSGHRTLQIDVIAWSQRAKKYRLKYEDALAEIDRLKSELDRYRKRNGTGD